MVRVTFVPRDSVPMKAAADPLATVQVPTEILQTGETKPAGSESVTDTLTADCNPIFWIVITSFNVEPAGTGLGVTVWLTNRLACIVLHRPLTGMSPGMPPKANAWSIPVSKV